MSCDWQEIKIEYITTKISLRNLAKKYNISESCVFKKSKEEHWHKERIKYNNEVVAKVVQKKANKEAKQLAKLQKCSDELDELISKFIKTKNEAKRFMTAMDLNFLTKSLKDAVNIKRDVYDILTPAQKEKIKIEKEKLKLEKSKVKTEKNNEPITIIFADEDKEEYAK